MEPYDFWVSYDKYKKTLEKTFSDNHDVNASLVSLVSLVSLEKYVGCVYCRDGMGRDVCVSINNSSKTTMLYYPEQRKIEYIGNLSGLSFSYTGGWFYDKDGCVYGFPRNSNKLLKVDLNNRDVEEIDIGLSIGDIDQGEIVYGHHYGGVLLGDKIYCPPRLYDYILLIDLKNYSCQKIHSPLLRDHRYNGAMLHPNGKIYFTPFNHSAYGCFDPDNETFRLIGDRLPVNVFGGTIYSDGSIYSFAQGKGLYRLDVEGERVELLCEKTIDEIDIGGSYGTITHYNGRIYNIPGNTKNFIEYDPKSRLCKRVFSFDDGRFNKAKWAGGQLLKNGNIYLTSAFGRFAAEITFGEVKSNSFFEELLYAGYFKGGI